MSSLIDNLNSDYQSASNVLTGKKKVLVYVEAKTDVPFWNHIFSTILNKLKYECEILPCSQSDKRGDGKKSLRKLANNGLSEVFVICIDSDYDYLLSNYNNESKFFQDNKFIFQTYSYSMENLLCFPSGIRDLMVDSLCSCDFNFDFEDFLVRYSNCTYEILLKNIFLFSKGDFDTFKISELSDLVGFVIDSMSDLDLGFRTLADGIERKINDLKNYAIFSSEYSLFKEEMVLKGLDKNSAYLFLNGHALFDKVLLPILNLIFNDLNKKIIEEIRAEYCGDEVGQRISNHKSNTIKPKDLLIRNKRYTDCFVFEKIRNDIFCVYKDGM